jgi:hypothetical protein
VNLRLVPSLVFVLLGVAIVARTAVAGATSPLAVGYIFGAVMVIVGVLRVYIGVRGGRG